MNDFKKMLKRLKIQDIYDISPEDERLISEAIRLKDITFLIIVIAKMLGKDKLLTNSMVSMSKEISALIDVNDNLINAVTSLSNRVDVINLKIEKTFIYKNKKKLVH